MLPPLVLIMASASLVLLVLAFFVFSAIVDAQGDILFIYLFISFFPAPTFKNLHLTIYFKLIVCLKFLVTVYCQPSDYANEALMQWMYDNGIFCEPITGTTTPSTSSKMSRL